MSSSPAGPASDGPRFAVVGAYVIDCIARTDRMPEWGESYQGESVHMAPGGKALNMAVALARMGAHVDAIGVVGDDLAGQTVVEALVREGVGIEGLEVRPGGRTPICMCFSRTDGETAFLWRIDDGVAADRSMLHGPGHAALSAADATIITFELAEAVAPAISFAGRHDGLVLLQPAPTNPRVGVNDLPWSDVDVLVPNEGEAQLLLSALNNRGVEREDLAHDLANRTGVPTVAVTLGGDGVLVYGDGAQGRHEAPPVDGVVDSTGASDAFTSRLAHELATGSTLRVAVTNAQLAARWTLGAVGGLGVGPPASQGSGTAQPSKSDPAE